MMSLGTRTVMSALLVILFLSVAHVNAQRSGGSGGGGSHTSSSYYRGSGTGSCSTTCGIILGSIFGGIGLVLLCIFICICIISKRQKIRRDIENQAYLDEPVTNTPTTHFDPAWKPRDGEWRGQYHGTSRLNYGDYNMNVDFTFHDGQITSQNGNDIVGAFTFTGQYRPGTRRLVMMKSYTNVRNDVVQYQGTFTTEYHMSGTWKLPSGDHGTWELRTDEPTTTSAIATPTAPPSYEINLHKPSQPVPATPVSNYHTEPSAPAAIPASSFQIEGHPTPTPTAPPVMQTYIPHYGTTDPIKPGVTYV